MSGVRTNVSLRSFNIWGVGGDAAALAEPRDIEELGKALRESRAPIFMLGLGSNILALDEGFDGTVVVHNKHLREMSRLEDGSVYAQCGVAQARLARFLAQQGLSGGEFHAGIPGTVGGGLAMNAGAFGSATWDHVVSVDVIDAAGQLSTRQPADFDVSYRRVQGLGKGEYFVGARLRFGKGDSKAIRARISGLLAERKHKQPVGERSCGSVFVNPPSASAGSLIEDCGLKGQRIGAAQISAKHANFIVNLGGAKSADILGLVRHIRQEVLERHRVRLEPEFRILASDEQARATMDSL